MSFTAYMPPARTSAMSVARRCERRFRRRPSSSRVLVGPRKTPGTRWPRAPDGQGPTMERRLRPTRRVLVPRHLTGRHPTRGLVRPLRRRRRASMRAGPARPRGATRPSGGALRGRVLTGRALRGRALSGKAPPRRLRPQQPHRAIPATADVPRPPSDWISLAEAAEIFAAANVPVTRGTLARWAAAGRLQSIRPGRKIYVRRAQVRHMLRPQRRAVRGDSVQGALFEEWTE